MKTSTPRRQPATDAAHSIGSRPSDDQMLKQANFKTRFFAEWDRINPRFRQNEMTAWQSFLAGCHQAVYGYVAPLRMLWWLCFSAKAFSKHNNAIRVTRDKSVTQDKTRK